MSDNKKSGEASSEFKPGNVGADGSYIVGRGRPPKHTQFAEGDGRSRGRRTKGQKNFDTEFLEEAKRKVTIREGGKERRVSKLRSVIIRGLDNAGAKGQNSAIANILANAQKVADRQKPAGSGMGEDEQALLDAWIEQQVSQRMAGDNMGDLEEGPQISDDAGRPDDDEADDS